MSDYGHDLLFGSFITPAAARPEDVVALALLSEAAGLDLVTFQDHPYQPAFLDAWTLMSFVAARTSTVRLSGNVLNLPLRQPVVLARAAASLDLLSGGRLELGLGAGGFWDAIEASGARRLEPGQAVDALDEAIGIIREIWAADRRGGYAWTAGTTARSAPSADPHRRTTSESGSARTSRGCCAWWGGLTDALLSHLSYEEREITGPLSRYGFYPGQI